MLAFFDSGALVKLVLTEAKSAITRERASEASRISVAAISQAEVAAALARSVRIGAVSTTTGRLAQRDFDGLWPDFNVIVVDGSVIRHAARLAWQHDLRGYEAVQLAAALKLALVTGDPVELTCFDHRLRDAANDAGLVLWPQR